jgi:hypothetical protein
MKSSLSPIGHFVVILALIVILRAVPLRAQGTAPFTVNGTDAEFEFLANGTLTSTGTFNSENYGNNGDTAVTASISWWPNASAFRAGVLPDSYMLSLYPIGQASTAFGLANSASGYAATASGWYNFATGDESVAMGYQNTAGMMADTAFGRWTYATGGSSVANNQGTYAVGFCSSASGYYTTSQSYDSFVVGALNTGGGNASTWVNGDPLFEVGNGNYTTGNSDAFEVLKNGNAVVSGTLTIAPGGDIPMFSGY